MKPNQRLAKYNIVACLLIIFYFEFFIWQRYFAARIYQKIENNGAYGVFLKINKESIASLESAVRLNPLASEYQFKMGELFLAEKSYVLAKEAFLNSLLLEPVNAFYHLKLGLADVSMSNIDEGAKEFWLAVELYPTNAALYYDIANYYEKSIFLKNRKDEVIDLYKKSLFLSDHNNQLKILGNIYNNQSQDYAVLENMIPDTAISRHTFAIFLKEKKLYNESILEFNKAISLCGQTNNNFILLDSYNWKGIVFLWQNKLNDAIMNFERAALLAKDNLYKAWVSRNLGNAYFENKEFEKAIDQYSKAIEYDPLNGYNHWKLGDAYEAIREKPKAAYFYRMALKFNLPEYIKKEISNKLLQ